MPIETIGLPIPSRNVSSSGMQLSCTCMNYRLMDEHFKEDALNLVIELPDGHKVNAQAKRKYASSYDDEYLIGVELVGLNALDQAAYTAYIERLGDKSK